ncbi:unnamed protein product [Protopolystoma xenopodis]|uniref:Uncharacterized protein n=1 Tax=Protopolystoma xenopodis TaxID=117903 RepID=A0A448WZ84_9PLAT|nr:unnamed protein product [Protopolystoma xenopodis]
MFRPSTPTSGLRNADSVLPEFSVRTLTAWPTGVEIAKVSCRTETNRGESDGVACQVTDVGTI